MADSDNQLVIPFGKAARVGNFKLWRSRMGVGSGRDKTQAEVINVSNLDGSWKVQIPSTSEMFGFICSQYATVDFDMRDRMLGMIFTNQMNVSLMPSPALHDGFWLLTEMMAFPYLLLSEKEMKERMVRGMKALGMEKQRIKEHVGEMLEYRRKLYGLIEQRKSAVIEAYEQQQAERRAAEPEAEKQLDQDEIAEQALDILGEEENNAREG